MMIDSSELIDTVRELRVALLARRDTAGVWRGRLSDSALATATAVFALARLDSDRSGPLVNQGLGWLLRHQNADGGWGDTPASRSNISTTLLAWSALSLPAAAALPESKTSTATPRQDEPAEAGTPNSSVLLSEQDKPVYSDNLTRMAITSAEAWLTRTAGGLEPHKLIAAVQARYAGDQTFAVPILTMCALAGRLGPPAIAWPLIKPLPFELAMVPHPLLKWCRISVVSYALPALIALGQVRFRLKPPVFPLTRLWRGCFVRPTLRKLERIQPASGGYLEAIPLTAFVCMSLGACPAIANERAVIQRGVEFLRQMARPDGAWPVDADLATWVTTLSVRALASMPNGLDTFPADEKSRLKAWLLGQQFRTVHPYTQAAPGGWSWTDRPGGVPDADDTSGALLALRFLAPGDPAVVPAAIAGVNWLLQLQNSDGGFPTFCRGWGRLPFDRSAPELTVHALRAMSAWQPRLPVLLDAQVTVAAGRGLRFLRNSQTADGAWLPLWFGNQAAPGELNPVYGTARVVAGLGDMCLANQPEVTIMLARGVQFLLASQNPDGGWGGAAGVTSSIEETAVSMEALATCGLRSQELDAALDRGVNWLLPRVREPDQITASPIGLYFARLWYAEELYPLIFALAALQRLAELQISDTESNSGNFQVN